MESRDEASPSDAAPTRILKNSVSEFANGVGIDSAVCKKCPDLVWFGSSPFTGVSVVIRTLFLLDEFAHLGRMRPVEQGVTLAGGYGATFWLLVQSMAQLRSVYGEAAAGTFLANADVLQAFGITDWETADHLSRLAGDATVRIGATTTTARGETSHLDGERGRRLITPDEIRLLPPDRALLIVRGLSPIAARRADYRRDRRFRGLYDGNPLHAG